MIVRNINNNIVVVSKIANFLIKIGYAIVLSNLIWWMVTPAFNDVYVNRVRISIKDDPVRYITNRYPFGEIIVVKPRSIIPPFSTLVKLHGVYVNGSDSMAFINYNGKNMAIQVGNSFGDDIKMTSISPESIVISQNKVDATIKISRSENNPNTNLSSGMGGDSDNNSYQRQNDNLMNKRNDMINRFSNQEANGNRDQNYNTMDSNSHYDGDQRGNQNNFR